MEGGNYYPPRGNHCDCSLDYDKLTKITLFSVQIDENDPKAYVNIFHGTIDIIVIIFVDFYKLLGHFSLKYHGNKQDIAETHGICSQQLPFF